MKKSNTYLLILIATILFSCVSETTTNNIAGNWQCVAWKVSGEHSDRNVSAVNFQFHEDNTYQANMGQQSEKGKFKIKNNQLYTTAEGQIEKMVKIKLKSKDTLLMDMNRVGTKEQLILVRK